MRDPGPRPGSSCFSPSMRINFGDYAFGLLLCNPIDFSGRARVELPIQFSQLGSDAVCNLIEGYQRKKLPQWKVESRHGLVLTHLAQQRKTILAGNGFATAHRRATTRMTDSKTQV
jgi:hypothetical protein